MDNLSIIWQHSDMKLQNFLHRERHSCKVMIKNVTCIMSEQSVLVCEVSTLHIFVDDAGSSIYSIIFTCILKKFPYLQITTEIILTDQVYKFNVEVEIILHQSQ